MSVVNDIVAIETFIRTQFPAATTGKEEIPLQPPANSFYIRALDDDRETETRYHFRVDRPYQIVHITQRPDTVLADMDALGSAFYQTELIGAIRIDGFTVSQTFKTENGLYAKIGILETNVRESRIQKTYPKINYVGIRDV